jgi:multiple sugar transport system ATP-binding protein
MRQGRIQQIGPPAEVYARPANVFVAGFLGSPGMNLLPGRLRVGDAGAAFEGALTLPLPGVQLGSNARNGQDIWLGIRPEHIDCASDSAAHAKVTLVEPMGNHQVVWLDVAGQALAVSMPIGTQLKPDDIVPLNLHAEHISLFDRATGNRLQ